MTKTLWPENHDREAGFGDVFQGERKGNTGEELMEQLRRVLASPDRERLLSRLTDQERERVGRVEAVLRCGDELRTVGREEHTRDG